MAEWHVGGHLLSAFLDDELADEAALRVTRHVLRCRRCEEELEGLRRTRAMVRRLPELQAPVLTSGVQRAGRWRRRVVRRARLVATAVLVPAAAVLGLYLAGGEEPGGVVPPAELFVVEHVARTAGGPVPTPVVTTPAGTSR